MTRTYSLQEAKTRLPLLAERAANGEEIVITRGGRPLAKLVPIEESLAPRDVGFWRGQVRIGGDFDDPLPWEIQQHFEGGPRSD